MYFSTALPELLSINATLSHVPTVGNLEELYPEAFGGVSCIKFLLHNMKKILGGMIFFKG